MQPTYLPWLGYFEMIDRSDVFVLMDDVQYVPKSWQQRNRIKTANGELMLSVPVQTSHRREQTIAETEIDARQPWAAKHLRTVQLSYARAPHLREHLPALQELYARPWQRLRDLNAELIGWMCRAMGIGTPIVP